MTLLFRVTTGLGRADRVNFWSKVLGKKRNLVKWKQKVNSVPLFSKLKRRHQGDPTPFLKEIQRIEELFTGLVLVAQSL